MCHNTNISVEVGKAAPRDIHRFRFIDLVPQHIYKCVEGLDLEEKRWDFAIKWGLGGGEGAQKEMRRPTATLPRVTKCLWFEFNLHSRFIRAPPISR